MIRLGLRTKFFLYSNTVIVVTIGLVSVLAAAYERRALFDALVSRGQSTAQVLAVPVADHLTVDQGVEGVDAVEEYLRHVVDRNPDLLVYAAVADSSGLVRFSSQEGQEGRLLPGGASLEQAPQARVFRGPGRERVVEARVPLTTGSRTLGILALGLPVAPVETQIKALAQRAGFIALLLMLGNSIMTAFYVETLIRPLLNLHRTMKAAGRGDFSVRARGGRTDEVGELAEAFNGMMDQLEEARDLEALRHVQLAHTEKMAAVGTLAAGIAHEVNNPLAGILTCIENIQANPDDEGVRERYLPLIHDGLKRISHTVSNLLDFSRPRSTRPEPTSLNRHLTHVVELVRFQLQKGQVELRMELQEDDPLVLADDFQMVQLFLNLVLNALQAMPNGGTLTLRSAKRGDRVVVEVADTGDGISEAIRDRIFDPFFTTREVGEGTGLGLAVSDSIVAAHGGTMEVESVEGKGSVFRTTFPAGRWLGDGA